MNFVDFVDKKSNIYIFSFKIVKVLLEVTKNTEPQKWPKIGKRTLKKIA